MVRPCYQDQKALGAWKTSARLFRQPKRPGKSRPDRFHPEIEALLANGSPRKFIAKRR